MIAVVLMIMFYLIHRFLAFHFALRSAACLCRFIGKLTFYPASCENESKLGREKLRIVEHRILGKS